MNFRKLAALLLVLVMLVAVFAGCGKKEAEEVVEAAEETTEQAAGLPNPLTEYDDAEALATATGLGLEAPEGASDVAYLSVNMGDEGMISEIRFTLDGKNYTYRAQPTAETSAIDISGCNYTWKETGAADVDGREAVTETCDEVSVVYWLDVVPGIAYSVSGDKASVDDVVSTANAVFVPTQGNVG